MFGDISLIFSLHCLIESHGVSLYRAPEGTRRNKKKSKEKKNFCEISQNLLLFGQCTSGSVQRHGNNDNNGVRTPVEEIHRLILRLASNITALNQCSAVGAVFT